jgi:hypothetical protein
VTESLLSKLLDEPLSSVVFVADYLQLDFNGSRFTAYAWPKVLIGTSTWEFGDSEVFSPGVGWPRGAVV